MGTGWSYYGGVPVSGTITTTQNYISLSPSSGTILPSNVSVTATLGGVQYPTKTSIISRTDIVETITDMSGASIVCSGAFAYTLNGNLQTGQSVSWSVSNTSIATLSNASNTGVTLNVTGNGALTLIATINNGCEQSYTRTKDLFAGAPPAFVIARGTAQSEYCDTKYHYVPFTISDKSPFLNYTFTGYSQTYIKVSSYTSDGFILKFAKNFSGRIEFSVSASNSCGTINAYSEAYIDNCSSIPYGNNLQKTSEPDSVFKVYPNPSNDVVYLDLLDADNIPEENVQINASLYDMMWVEMEEVRIEDNKALIDVSGLNAGLYVLRVTIGDAVETHLISVK